MVEWATNRKTAKLNNGVTMPVIGLGIYDMHGREAEKAIGYALETGYRLIDTAAMYGNEKEAGLAMSRSGIPRDEIFITTKVDNSDQGYDQTLKAFDISLNKLNTDYVDCYLVHWPVRGKRKDTWRAIEQIYKQGRARVIGVANYLLPFLDELHGYAEITPMVNQVEFSPFLFLKSLLESCNRHSILLQAYTPLSRGRKLNHPLLQELAGKYHKTAAQIILRWDLQVGVSAIPKSSHPHRIRENWDIFEFQIAEEDMRRLNNLNEDFRVVGDPMAFY